MRRLLTAFGLGLAFAGPSLANPAMTTVDTQMREAPNARSRVVQSIPANAQIDVQGCGPAWCSASWRDVPGFVRASAVVPGAAGPLHGYPDGPPPPPPVVVAPFGFGYYGYGWGHPWHHYY